MKIGTHELLGEVVPAPLAGITDAPFRLIMQSFGVGALWTEMVSAHALVKGKDKRTTDIIGHRAPTLIQLCGADPDVMAEAARIAEQTSAAGIDINMGCPVKKVVKQGAGAALMKNPRLASRITAAIRDAVDGAVTVKLRSGWDEANTNAPEMARILEQEGADAITIHSRSRSKGHSGPASMEVIARVKDAVGIPVIGNGGVIDEQTALSMKRATGCDGIMVGRGLLGRPWLPAELSARLRGIEWKREPHMTLAWIVTTHYRDALHFFDTHTAVRRMRKHLVWYSRGLRDAVEFRREVLRLEDPATVLRRIGEFFENEAE